MYRAVTKSKTFNRALIPSVYFKSRKHQADYANFRPLSLGMCVSCVVIENVPLFHQRTSFNMKSIDFLNLQMFTYYDSNQKEQW